jgi:RNA polymerase primary sigma factor
MKMVDGEILEKIESDEHSSIARLVEIGRQKSFITIDDILALFPEAERNMGQLEAAFAALLSAGIPFIEGEVPEEFIKEPREPDEEETEEVLAPDAVPDDDYLENIDTDDIIGLYLRETGWVPLLTAAEEVDLAERIERGREARTELASGNTNYERRKELQDLIEDGWAAREHLIKANSRLVISVAKKYMKRGVPFQDLIQEGNIGLIRATKKFNHHLGNKFSTYATWWIRQAITRAIADQGRTIRVPVHMGDKINRFLRIQHELTQRLGSNPSIDDLSEALEISPKQVEYLMQVARRPLSLETPMNFEGDSVLGDFIEDWDAAAPDDTAATNLLREDLEDAFTSLPPREVRILQLRYGMLDGQVYTLEAVGRKMGVTRERVRQIEAQALSRLRHPAIRKKLQAYLDVQ